MSAIFRVRLVVFLTGFLLGASLLLTSPAFAQNVTLSSKTSIVDVAPSLRLFRDADKKQTFRQIHAQFKNGGGEKISGDTVYLGHGGGGYWLVFNVLNTSPGKSHWVLDFGTRRDGTIGVAERLAVFSTAAPDDPMVIDGRSVKNKRHLAEQKRNALTFSLDNGKSYTIGVYIEPVAGLPLAVKPRLEESAVFAQKQESRALYDLALKAAAILVVGIILMFMPAHGKDIPLLLSFYLIAQYAVYTTSDELISFGNNTGVMLLDIAAALGAVFALTLAKRVYYPTDNKSPWRVLPGFLSAIVILLTLAGYLSDDLRPAFDVAALHLLPLVIPGVILALGVLGSIGRDRPPPLVFVLSWLVLLGGAAMTEITALGLAAYSAVGINFYWLCFVLHFSLLSFSALHHLIYTEEKKRKAEEDRKHKQEEETEFRKSKELADQSRLLGILQREKELIADLRNRESERVQAMRRAKEISDNANKAKSDFLAVISHEIRTPMTGVMGMVRLLLDTSLTSKQKEYVETIQYAGDGLITLLNDILDLSKAEEGKMTIETVNFDLAKLMESVVLLMSGRSEEKKLALKSELGPEVPTALKGDPTRLRQILLNLVSNAIKFTDRGTVTVSVKAYDMGSARPRLLFSVKDTGIGMSPDTQKKLFSPYAQADASISRLFGGTGLGLAICKRLVEAMGSTIQVESKLGGGTTFYFILAFDAGTAESDAAAEKAAPVRPMKILVVDDNTINQRVVTGLLERDGHKVTTAGSAEAALKELELLTFDAIFMDVEMPGTDGLAAAGMIRKLSTAEKAAVPVIAMTGNVGKEDIKRCKDAGMNDHIGKPVTPENLRRALSKLSPSPAAAASASAPQPAVSAPVAPVSAITPDNSRLFNLDILGSLKGSLPKDQLKDMIQGLYDKAEELIAAAEKAVTEKDSAALGKRGHDIKGMTANFGLAELSNIAGQIERKAKDGWEAEKLAPLVTQLRPVYTQTRQIVDAWIEQ